MEQRVVVGDDGVARCPWAVSTPDYARYHDTEWGVPLHGDQALFERLTLEAFQSGLSWLTILRKREGFRAAFDAFDVERVAAYDDDDRARLLADAGIVRNRAKIDATITNARAAAELRAAEGDGALDALVWSFAPKGRRRRPRRLDELAAATPESTALAKALKARGFVFVGPTTMHAAMQACGLVNDHLAGCHAVARRDGGATSG
jgi:DNA-3-methyladenine glycosylase I